MAIEIVPYEAALLPLVLRFAEATWKRPATAAQIRWRYDEAPGIRAFVALDGGECVAMVRALHHVYRIDGAEVPFLETFDWYQRAGMRGLGGAVMRRCMEEPISLLQVGGTPDACASLKRLGWQEVCTGQRFILPLAPNVARAIESRLHLPRALATRLAALGARVSGPRRRRRPPGDRVVPLGSVGAEVHALYAGPTAYRTLALWSPERLRWLLCGHPAAGHYVPLGFARGEALVAWALLRVFTHGERCAAEIVDLLAPDADPAIYAWAIGEMAVIAAGFGAGLIATTTTCPAVKVALARNAFRAADAVPVHAWLRHHDAFPGPQLLGSNTRDTAINPFASWWWGEAIA